MVATPSGRHELHAGDVLVPGTRAEPRLQEMGADYVKDRIPLMPFIAVDRNVDTGQSPASSACLAERLIADHGAAR